MASKKKKIDFLVKIKKASAENGTTIAHRESQGKIWS